MRAKRSSAEYREAKNARSRARYASEPHYRIDKILRRSLSQALKLHGGSKRECVLKLLGCTVPELIVHLEAQWLPGMTWENYGQKGWHIDHKRPCASFDLTDRAQQAECWNFKNLQPLWAFDSHSKKDKWAVLARNEDSNYAGD